MAVGDGGFKQVPLGFDKNEVNAYIADLRKKQKAMEEEVRANTKKTEEAVKLAEEADARIQAAVKAGDDKALELKGQLEVEKAKTADLTEKLKNAREELDKEKKNMSDMLMSGKGVNAEAQKAYKEVISKANDDAKGIIADAEAKAQEILAAAEARRIDTDTKTTEFLNLMKSQLEAFSEGYSSIAGSAAELLGSSVAAAPVIKMPEVSVAPAAPITPVTTVDSIYDAKEEPIAEAAEEPDEIEESEPEANLDDISNAAAAALAELTASFPEVQDEPENNEAMPAVDDSDDGDTLASFDDAWGGNELAQTIFNDEKKDAVPLVNPDARDMFGKDLFGLGSTEEEELTADLVVEEPVEEEVEDIQPLDVSDHKTPSFDSGFDKDLLSQTMNSNSLSEVSDDLLEAVKAAEATFAVKPNEPNVGDLDMDDMDETSANDDDPMAALREVEAALNGMAGGLTGEVEVQESAPAADPWADLQAQLEAMQANGATGNVEITEPSIAAETVPAQEDLTINDPAAPSADDSSIWNFGSSSDSDDDMSGDFGGFGGF